MKVFLLAVLPVTALLVYGYVVSNMDRWFYNRYGYCNACNRLSPEAEKEMR